MLYVLAVAEDVWPSEWLRAILWACVLQVVADHGEAYGYQIAATLKERGLGVVGGGTLYPVLKRLEGDDLVTSEWRKGEAGPGRKFYRLTPRGRKEINDVEAEWTRFVEATSSLFRSGGAGA